MFRIIKNIESDEMNEMFMADLIIILKKINQLRKENGKDDYVKLISNRTNTNAGIAFKTKGLVTKTDYNTEVKLFLKEIK